MELEYSPDLYENGRVGAGRSRRAGFLVAALVTALVAPRMATAEIAASAERAQEWMAAKQRNEASLVQKLKAKFNENPAIKAGLKEIATKLLEEVKYDIVEGEATAIDGVNRIQIRNMAFGGSPGASDQEKALAKVDALLRLDPVPVDVLGDIMWMHNFAIAYQRNARTTEMFAHQSGIGGIPAETVWAEKPSVSPVGRHRVTSGADIAGLKTNNDATDPAGLHAEVVKCSGCALRRTAMRPTSVMLRLEKALGYMVGSDLSGTTNVYTWQLQHIGLTDPLWKLIPIVTMVSDGDHSLLEVAMVLHSHGYIDLKIGDYRTLLPETSTHPAAAEVRAILAEATAAAGNVPMYCWYGNTNQVISCRRTGSGETVKDLAAGEAYAYFATASADATGAVPVVANPLSPMGFLKADPEGFPFAPGGPSGAPMMCDYDLTVGTTRISHPMPCKFKAVKVADGTVFYKGGYKSEGWTIGGGYVSHLTGASAYARGILNSVEKDQTKPSVSMYSIKAKGDQYLIDIRDLNTMKALLSIPGGLDGYDELRALAPKLAYEGSGAAFPADQIASLYGFLVNDDLLPSALAKACAGRPSSCLDTEFAKVKSAGNPYARYVKTLADLVTMPWSAVASFHLYRFSVFLKNTETSGRVVPDTTITEKLCPYLAQLGFAGWYGGNNIMVNRHNTLIEEIYFCWRKSSSADYALKDPGRSDDETAWAALPATTPPAAPAAYFPKRIVKIPSGSAGKTVNTTAVSPINPADI